MTTDAYIYHLDEAESLLAELRDGSGSHGRYAPAAVCKAQAAQAHIMLATELRNAEESEEVTPRVQYEPPRETVVYDDQHIRAERG